MGLASTTLGLVLSYHISFSADRVFLDYKFAQLIFALFDTWMEILLICLLIHLEARPKKYRYFPFFTQRKIQNGSCAGFQGTELEKSRAGFCVYYVRE